MKNIIKIQFLIVVIMTTSFITFAQSKPTNPFGLVYRDAITENVSGKVNIHPVNYKLNGIEIAANVYTPANYEPSKSYPAIVVAHPNGGIKEQVAGLYAQRLAESGYITIAADASYQGASGGEPRNVDKPANRINDVRGMADFITQYAGVDVERLGVLGICGGGGYSLAAAQTDKRFKAVATLSMFNSGVVRRNGFMNSQVSTIQERLEQASEARAQEAAGGEILYAADSEITDEMADKMPFDLYREGHYYYHRTHAHPNSTFRYTMSSLLDLMAFDAAANMELINQPLLMMAGSKADSYYMTDRAFSMASGTTQKELFLINGATHIQTYYVPEYVEQAMNKLNEFFGKYTSTEQEIVNLSKEKWQWMADKNVDKLAELFHEDSRFIHMSGTWGKERELEIIKSGSIWYKQADVHDVVAKTFGNTVLLWNRITLIAHVRGNDVSNEFTVTEVYQKQGNTWKMLDLTFSSVRDTHTLEH